MATNADVNGIKKVLFGGLNNNPTHFGNGKRFIEKVGGDCIALGILAGVVGIIYQTGVDWLIKPVKRPKPNVFRRRR